MACPLFFDKKGANNMAKNKFYTKTKVINGTKYVAQFSGLSNWVRALDSSYIEGTNQISTEALANYILENVIVEPKGLTIDDFETMKEFNAVTNFGRDVAQGLFRDETTDDTADKEKG